MLLYAWAIKGLAALAVDAFYDACTLPRARMKTMFKLCFLNTVLLNILLQSKSAYLTRTDRGSNRLYSSLLRRYGRYIEFIFDNKALVATKMALESKGTSSIRSSTATEQLILIQKLIYMVVTSASALQENTSTLTALFSAASCSTQTGTSRYKL